MKIYIGNDNLLTVDELKNAATGAYINDATVTATLTDADGTEVTGQTWPTTLAYIAASNGTYRGSLSNGLSLDRSKEYRLEVAANGGAGLVGEWTYRVYPAWRNA